MAATTREAPAAMAQTTPLIISCGCWWENDTRTRVCPAHNRPRR